MVRIDANDISERISHEVTTLPNVDPSEDSPLLESALFESTSDLATSKGYEVASKTSAGLSMLISRPVEVFAGSYILDVIPLLFDNGGGRIRYDDEGGAHLQVVEGESNKINELCRDLANKTERLRKTLFHRDHRSITCKKGQYSKSIVQGLENCSVNMILSRINYSTFNGKSVGFWITPVFLTSLRPEDQMGNSVPWIPIQHGLSKGHTDVVSVSSFASYLDFRDREVRILGRELLSNGDNDRRFPDALRLFRILSACISIMLIAAFFVFGLNGAGNFLAVLLALGLAAFVEVLGGLRLIKSYHSLQRNNLLMQEGSPSISAEQIVKAEKEFLPDERPLLYWKYCGTDLSKLTKETNLQKIDELESKSKEILSRTTKLENDELYSEAILSYDRALRAAITAVFITMGIDTQGSEIEESFPILKRLFEGIKLEEIKFVKALRDRVNGGYDATRTEEERVREVAAPLIDQSLDLLRSYKTKGSSQTISLLRALPTSVTYSDPATHVSRYRDRLRSLISAAYSAKDNRETKTFLNKLEQAIAAAACIKIIQLTGKIPASLTVTELLKQLENSTPNPIQQQVEEKIQEWIGKLKEGKIKTDEDINEFENQCISFLHSPKVLGELAGTDHPRLILDAQDAEPVPAHTANKSPTIGESVNEKAALTAQEQVTPKPRISKDILNTVSSLKFLLDASEDNELLDIGPGGARLLEAKKELQSYGKTSKQKQVKAPKEAPRTPTYPSGDYSEIDKTDLTETGIPTKLSDELTSITDSLDHSQDGIEQAEDTGEKNDTTSDTIGALPMVMPFENLGDFKKALLSGVLPTVVAYLSDDEPSSDVGHVMDQLAKKYHGRVAFISVDSRFRDIAIESKIKSYPTVLMFRKDKTIAELKSLEPNQLERELLQILEPRLSTAVKGETSEDVKSPKSDYEVEPEMEQAKDNSKVWGSS
jgi:thiol-disulfide isomerase/thioredoxin